MTQAVIYDDVRLRTRQRVPDLNSYQAARWVLERHHCVKRGYSHLDHEGEREIMIRPESFAPNVPYASSRERTAYSYPVTRLDESQIEISAGIFGRALHDEPRLVYMIPNSRTRETVLPWLLAAVIRASEIYGETFIAPSTNSGAIWIRPGNRSGFQHTLQDELRRLPFKLPSALLKRWLRVHTCLEQIHQQLAVRPHWHLVALATETFGLTNTTAAAVIAPLLARADFEGVECYVETFQESALPFYQERGFRIQGSGRITKSGPNFWIMMRKPRPSQ